LPILALLVLGIIEFGWLFNGWIAMRSAAREGARVAVALKELEETGYITEAVQKHLSNPDSILPALTPNIENVAASLDHPILPNNPNNPKEYGVTVTATGEIKPLIGFFVGSDNFVLTGQASMRIE